MQSLSEEGARRTGLGLITQALSANTAALAERLDPDHADPALLQAYAFHQQQLALAD